METFTTVVDGCYGHLCQQIYNGLIGATIVASGVHLDSSSPGIKYYNDNFTQTLQYKNQCQFQTNLARKLLKNMNFTLLFDTA